EVRGPGRGEGRRRRGLRLVAAAEGPAARAALRPRPRRGRPGLRGGRAVTGVALAWAALALAAGPALLYLVNLAVYRPAPRPRGKALGISVLIPARNEERGIVAAVESALASEGVSLEVIVLDDHSEDRTAALVEGLARRDSRVRLVPAPPLPEGWCG